MRRIAFINEKGGTCKTTLAVNVAIAILLIAYLNGNVGIEDLEQFGDPRASPVARLAAVNIFLVVFNMIPAFPMDGGRVLRALLAFRIRWARATQIAANIGQGFAFVLGFIGLFSNPILVFIAIFVYLAAAAEAQNAQIREIASSIVVDDVMVREFATLPESATISDAIDALLATTQHEFPVVGSGGALRGVLTRDGMIRALREQGPGVRVLDVMRTEIPAIHHRCPLQDALRLLQDNAAPAVAVLDGAGRLIGLVTHELIGEMMMVRSARPEGFPFRRRRESIAPHAA